MLVAGALAALALARPVRAEEPGDQGALRLTGLQGNRACFDTNSKVVDKVCGRFTVHWKIWVLMGEPIGNYVLDWQADSVTIRRPDAGQRDAGFAQELGSLPPPLAQAAKGMDLYVNAIAHVEPKSRKHQTWRPDLWLPFDTGVGVRPGTERSFNVPSGYDWDKLFIQRAGAVRCENIGKTYLDAPAAKAIVLDGLELNSMVLCKSSLASVDGLERAVQRLCEAERARPSHVWCRTRQGPAEDAAPAAVGDLLDEAADAPRTQRKLAELRAAFQEQATRACKATMGPIDACFASAGCQGAAADLSARCDAIPTRPRSFSDCVFANTPLLTATRIGSNQPTREESERRRREDDEAIRAKCAAFDDRQPAAWDKQWRALSDKCRARPNASAQVAQCRQAAAPRCNPAGTSLENCIASRMAGPDAPGAAQARNALGRERAVTRPAPTGDRPNLLD